MKTLGLLLLGTLAMTAQEKSRDLPKRGDTVLVKGCLTGGRIESNEVKARDGDAEFIGMATYRLTGDKKLLETIKKDHEGHEDVLTAVLKSELPRDPHKRIGNTRIGIGLPQKDMNAPPPLPVLEVKSIDHTVVTCK